MVPQQRRRFEISNDSSLGIALREAEQSGEELEVVVGDHTLRVRVCVPGHPTRKHDPDRTREALRQSAGALKGVDIEQLLRDLREQREQDSQGRPA
jgi:hypothetical protein